MLEHVERRRLPLPETGVEIALLDWGGSGPLALLHHANGFCAALWDLVARPLTRHFRVVAMDGRGHGDSSAPQAPEHYAWRHFGSDLAAVAEALAAEHGGRVALGLGHSFGGTSMVLAAARRPALFERLLLVDPVLRPPLPPGPPPPHVNLLVEGARRRRAVWPSRDAAREAWAGKSLFANWLPEALELYVQEGLRERPDGQLELKCAPQVEAAVFAHGPPVEAWHAGRSLVPPTLLLWAAHGDFQRANYEAFAARLPAGEVRDVDAGHLVPMERPDLVVEAALRHTAAPEPVQDSVG